MISLTDMLIRKRTSKTSSASQAQQAWFTFATSLFPRLCSDYIALRLLYHLEPFTTGLTILPKMIEVAEKSLKLYVIVKSKSTKALKDAASEYAHNVEKLRKASVMYSPIFDDSDICRFTKILDDPTGQLYQFLRYGAEANTEGFEADLGPLMLVIDKIFFNAILQLPDSDKKILVFNSSLRHLLTGSHFDQSNNRELLILALRKGNNYFDDFLNYCQSLDAN